MWKLFAKQEISDSLPIAFCAAVVEIWTHYINFFKDSKHHYFIVLFEPCVLSVLDGQNRCDASLCSRHLKVVWNIGYVMLSWLQNRFIDGSKKNSVCYRKPRIFQMKLSFTDTSSVFNGHL